MPCVPEPCLLGGPTLSPPVGGCPEVVPAVMSVPAALAVGAAASLLAAGICGAVGYIIRYLPPFISGFILVATIIIIWYVCSHYPETTREMGQRAIGLFREAASSLADRAMTALQHRREVSFSGPPWV